MNKSVLLGLVRRNEFGGLWELLRLSVLRRVPVMTAYRPKVYYRAVDTGARLDFDIQVNPLVSIIIPVHDHWEYTYSCLYSILRNTSEIAYELIVADDCSVDETRNILDRVSGIRVVRSGENLGFLRSCNRAAREAAGKYLLFLNNDTNVQPRWLNGLASLLEGDSSVGLGGSKLVYPDGRLQDAGGIVWNEGSCWIYGRWDDPNKQKYNRIIEADYVSGACMIIRKELWEEIGGFDERYSPAYYEDTDLAFEVRKRGYKVVYQPESVVVHFEGVSCGRDNRKGIKSFQEINREKFLRKWETVLRDEYPEPGTIKLRSERKVK
jgi:GT2 family glycosyltransferase